jgi:mannose-6-phosphate isomerase-like protein (cupin superfamily)
MNTQESYSINLDVKFAPLEVVDIQSLVNTATDAWYNQSLSRVNDCIVRLGVVQGEFHWHKHDNEDEFFYVVEGHFIIDMEDHTIELDPRQRFTIPKGVMHRPRAPQKTVIIMIDGIGGKYDRQSSTHSQSRHGSAARPGCNIARIILQTIFGDEPSVVVRHSTKCLAWVCRKEARYLTNRGALTNRICFLIYAPKPIKSNIQQTIVEKILSWFYPIINFGRYCSASARCTDWISPLPAKSAMVRANFNTR